MPPLFSPFQVRVDPWEVDYGSETPLEPSLEETEETTNVEAEVGVGDWRPMIPSATQPLPDRVFFVDGVRRLETRLLVNRDGRYLHGAFGSLAIGCVLVSKNRASFGESSRQRLLVFGSGEKPPHDVEVQKNLTYRATSAAESEPDAPLRAIQSGMRRAEGQLARRLTEAGNTLVVADGPLTFEEQGRGLAVGLIKRITRWYLPDPQVSVVARLPEGSRSPLFIIRSKNERRGFARFAWFLRLAKTRFAESVFHGLVRLEAHEAVGLDTARALADATTLLLPRFAPSRARDPRSPQNLLPIGALEQRLRRELGDQQLLRRWIETLVAKEVARA